MRRLATVLGVALANALAGSAGLAEEPDVPGLEFLEYLGTWQAEDEEWVIEAEWENDAALPEADARPQPDTERNEDE